MHRQCPAVVLFHNPTGKWQPQPPSTLLGGKPWLEDAGLNRAGHALSGILQIQDQLVVLAAAKLGATRLIDNLEI
jgi:hypothetical protein